MKENIISGIGISIKDDSFSSAKEAAENSKKDLNSKEPIISFVFFAGDYDPYKLSDGLKSVFKTSEFVGGSADALIYKTKLVKKGVIVLSIYSDYLHIGISSKDGVSKDPYKITKEVLKNALNQIKIDKYVDPYIQYTRMKNSNVRNLIRIPSYFSFIFSRGFKPNQMGNESLIIESLSDELSLNIPIFGGSFGVPLETVFSGKPYEIYSLHSGKVMKDGIISMIIVTNLVYQHTIENGCIPTKNIGYISKSENNGFVVSGISGVDPIAWYCCKLKITKDEFLSKQGFYTQMFPLGIPDDYGSFIIRAGGVPYSENKLAYTLPFIEGNPVFIMDASIKNLLNNIENIKTDYKKIDDKSLKPKITFSILCASRRLSLKDNAEKELELIKKTIGCDLFGLYSFSEIGSKPGRPTKIQHLSSSLFTLYDTLLTQLK